MNVKAFFVTALGQALELGIGTADDVVRHVTPDVLATHLPRPLWARLLTACLGAPRVDAQLVVETIGVPNLCEHVPERIIWGCIRELAQRSLGHELSAAPAFVMPASASAPSPTRTTPLAMTPPPPAVERVERTPSPPAPIVAGPSIPAPATSFSDVVASLEADDRATPAPSRARTPTSQRFRASNTGIGRLAATNARRPQAPAVAPEPARTPSRRSGTEVDELETEVGREDWKSSLAVEDENYVEWQGGGEQTNDPYGRKR